MIESKRRIAGVLGLALGTFLLGTAVTTGTASSQGGYFGQRATQDRDYSRMQGATQRAFRSETVTINKKAKKKKKKRAKKQK